MPKELTHWYIAENAALDLPDGEARRILNHRFKSDYLLGAVSPDTLYYGPSTSHSREAADRAHGTHGENTYAFLERFSDESSSDAAYAFLCGLLVHIAADSVFHPVVYYFCGTESSGAAATERHWIFETRMDLFVRRNYPARRYRDLLKTSSLSRKELIRLLSLYFFGGASDRPVVGTDPESAIVLSRSVLRFARIQALFSSRAAAGTFGAAALLFPSVRRFLGLSYVAQAGEETDAFARPINYRHPVAGDGETVSFEDLTVRAVRRAVPLFEKLRHIFEIPDPSERLCLLSEFRGPSLETGLEPTPEAVDYQSQMTDTHPELFEKFFSHTLL
jgi:hypothetical protein